MDSRIVSPRRLISTVFYNRSFEYTDGKGGGFAFACDVDGNLAPMSPEARANFDHCIDGTLAVWDNGVASYHHNYWEPATMRCDCGAYVTLDDSLANHCDRCGAYYNGSAQRLAHMREWTAEDRYAVFGPQNQPEDQ